MRRSFKRAPTRAALLLLLGFVGAAPAIAHHHGEASTPPTSCGLCIHAASVAVTTGPLPSFDRAPVRVVSATLDRVDTEEGSRTEPRGRGPPPTAPVL